MPATRTVICYSDNEKGFGALEVEEGSTMSEIESLAHEAYGHAFDQFIVLKNGKSYPEIVGQWRRDQSNGVKFLDEVNASPSADLTEYVREQVRLLHRDGIPVVIPGCPLPEKGWGG